MQCAQLDSFLRLYHVNGLGRVSLCRLVEIYDFQFDRIIAASNDELKSAGLKPREIDQIRHPDQTRIDREMAWAEIPGNNLVPYFDENYPPLLRETTDYPPLLYASGNLDLLGRPQIAIVGSRNCSPGGARTAYKFAAYLSAHGITITSGMATGIDAQAHLGALGGDGSTIAVTGTGLDRIYPAKNRQLAYDIHRNGLLISEFSLGTAPRKDNFPRRNRIISGLSLGTLVVEATDRSGSLITAREASEQGREVFAIPGSIHNPQARGCHRLIQNGAHLVEKASDIVDELASLLGFVADKQIVTKSELQGLDPESESLLNAIGYDPVSTDELVERSGLTIDKLSSMLVLLEINDLIESAPGGCYVRI